MIIVTLVFAGFVWLMIKGRQHAKEDKAFRRALANHTITKKEARSWLSKNYKRYPVTARMEFNQMISELED